jgi:hypothetical protein
MTRAIQGATPPADISSRWNAAAFVLGQALVWLFFPQSAFPWGNTVGHRKIVEQAVELIERDHPGEYNEISYHSPLIRKGAEDEDKPFWSVKDHFHNPWSPLDNKGLSTYVEIPGVEARRYDQNGYFHESAVIKSMRLFQDAASLYRLPSSDPRMFAWDKIGHVAHLTTGDLFQPQHVHDDAHLLGTAGSSSIEDRYDKIAAQIPMGASWQIRLYQRPPLTSVKLATIGTQISVFTSTNSRYSGVLTDGDAPQPDGTNGFISISALQPPDYPRPVFFAGLESAQNPNERGDHYRIILPDGRQYYYDPRFDGDIVAFFGAFSPNNPRRQDWWEVL